MGEKPQNPFKEVSYKECDDNDFNIFVKKCYPFLKNYEFAAIAEAANNSYYTFSVGKYSLSDSDKEDMETVRRTGIVGPWKNGSLFDMLYEDGFLLAGSYRVNVDW